MSQYVDAVDYMCQVREEHRDPLTGEVNLTHLAEDAGQHFNLWEGDDVPEWLYELAFDLNGEVWDEEEV